MTTEEQVLTHAGEEDRRHRMCKCGTCGDVSRCTPSNDFYGKDGEPLQCERCMMAEMTAEGCQPELLHMIPSEPGVKPNVLATKEDYVAFVEKVDKRDWYFTFGSGQPWFGYYTVIHGTRDGARAEMFRRHGDRWSMQYGSAEEAGVEQWKLKRLK